MKVIYLLSKLHNQLPCLLHGRVSGPLLSILFLPRAPHKWTHTAYHDKHHCCFDIALHHPVLRPPKHHLTLVCRKKRKTLAEFWTPVYDLTVAVSLLCWVLRSNAKRPSAWGSQYSRPPNGVEPPPLLFYCYRYYQHRWLHQR